MADEYRLTKIVGAMIARFEEIDPANDPEYWYKPDAVAKCDVLDERTLTGASHYQEVILIAPYDEYDDVKTTGPIQHTGEVYVLIARQYKPGVIDPFTAKSKGILMQWDIQDRLVRDLTRAIELDYRWKVDGVFLADETKISEINRNFQATERWAVVIMLVKILWDHAKRMP